MELESFRKKGVTWVRVLGTDKTLFKHCAENKSEVTMSKYTATVRPLLFMHGVVCISVKHKHNRG